MLDARSGLLASLFLAQVFEAWRSLKRHRTLLPARSAGRKGCQLCGIHTSCCTGANAVELAVHQTIQTGNRPMKPSRCFDFASGLFWIFVFVFFGHYFFQFNISSPQSSRRKTCCRPGDGVPWEWFSVIPKVEDHGEGSDPFTHGAQE